MASHSRKAYSEAVDRQTTENFIRCLENAFWHFGGVARTLVPDNLRGAVKKADWFDPDLNPKIEAFCRHYGTVIAVHAKQSPGRFSTDTNHLSHKKIATVERGAAWLLAKASGVGPHPEAWATSMMAERGVQGLRLLQGLLALAHKHSSQDLENACEIAHSYGAYQTLLAGSLREGRMLRAVGRRDLSSSVARTGADRNLSNTS